MTPTTTTAPAGPALPGHPDLGARGALLLEQVRLPRLGPADPTAPVPGEDLRRHVERLGPRPLGGPWLLGVIDAAGVTGRGGGHVPTALRWRRALRGGGPLTVVANGAESEPLAAKDGTLLRQRPHLVLDGLALAAEALGASRAVVWLHGDDDGARLALAAALAERDRAGVPGPRVEVVDGPVHYLAGESRAIARALAGGPALPTARRPAEPGAPRTHVQNVETLARISLLARGRPPSATVLLTVLTAAARVVVEVDRATTLAEAVARAGGTGSPHGAGAGRPDAVLLGGYGGTWARWADVAAVPVDEPEFRAAGLSLGAGVVAPLAPGACGLAETAAIARYLAGMSARQCGPCLFGLPAIARGVRLLADARAGRGDLALLRDDLGAVEGRGACHHPDGATRLVASALAVFAEDAEAHRRGRPCAGARGTTLPVPGVAGRAER